MVKSALCAVIGFAASIALAEDLSSATVPLPLNVSQAPSQMPLVRLRARFRARWRVPALVRREAPVTRPLWVG